MKFKFNLNGAAIKRFLLYHGDKIAFSVAGICFLMFAYSALSREKLPPDRTPDGLTQQVQEASNVIAITEPPGGGPKIPVIRATVEHILEQLYDPKQVWKPPPVDPKSKRTEPPVFALEQPRTGGGYGTFAFIGDGIFSGQAKPSGSRGYKPDRLNELKVVRWTVITALVPRKKQAQAFEEVFQNAEGANPQQDRIEYVGQDIERAEGTAGPWKSLDAKQLMATIDQWAGTMAALTDQQLHEKGLVVELGPLVGAEWTEAVAHPPQIPLLSLTPTDEKPRVVRPPRRGAAAPPRPTAQEKAVAAGAAEHSLYRFFDFTVESGKQYRYRIRLRLHNPNFGVAERYLKDRALARKQTLETPWVETPLVSVPREVRILAGAVPTPKPNAEPLAKVLISTIDKSSGIEFSAEAEAGRGTLLNRILDGKGMHPALNEVKTQPKLPFRTETLVLDIHGGQPVGNDKTQTEPGEVLLVDSGGNLIVRSELDDLESYKEKLIEEKAEVEVVDPARVFQGNPAAPEPVTGRRGRNSAPPKGFGRRPQ